jgi:hypothetical protein
VITTVGLVVVLDKLMLMVTLALLEIILLLSQQVMFNTPKEQSWHIY